VQNEGYNIQDVTGLFRRRARLVGMIFLVISMLGIVVAYSLQNLYRSSGAIVIERPEVSERFLPGTFQNPDREQRIARINEEVMTRDNLAEIIEKHNLYPEERAGRAATSVVTELRQNFELELTLAQDDPRNKYPGEVQGFEISFYHPDPSVARSVARDIVDLFLEGNRARRQVAYDETAAALTRESDTLRGQVSNLEAELANFKTEHPGAMPEDRAYNRQVAERKARDLDGLEREIRSLQERKTLLQSQLAQTDLWITAVGPDGTPLPASDDRLRSLQAEYLRLLGNYNSNHPDVVRVKREIESLTGGTNSPVLRQAILAELTAKRAELVDARTQYGDNHPDVRSLERSIATLEAQLEKTPEQSANTPPPNNPAYINLDLQLQGVNNELAALRADRTQLQQETVDLDKKVLIAPEVERRYTELTRDLGLARQQYEDTMSRLMAVQRAGILEEEELSERYVVTRMPSLSYTPAYPNRPLIIAIAIFLGITFGIGGGLLAEALDGTVRGTRDIYTILGAPPIAAVPRIMTGPELVVVKRHRVLAISAVVLSIVIVATYVQLQRSGAI